MSPSVPPSNYPRRAATALDYLQLALDLYTREKSQPWKTLRHKAEATWDNVPSELSQLAAAIGLGPDEARLAVLCDRIQRYIKGDDIDPTHWKLTLSGMKQNGRQFDKLIRRGVRLTNTYARLINIGPFAA